MHLRFYKYLHIYKCQSTEKSIWEIQEKVKKANQVWNNLTSWSYVRTLSVHLQQFSGSCSERAKERWAKSSETMPVRWLRAEEQAMQNDGLAEQIQAEREALYDGVWSGNLDRYVKDGKALTVKAGINQTPIKHLLFTTPELSLFYTIEAVLQLMVSKKGLRCVHDDLSMKIQDIHG